MGFRRDTVEQSVIGGVIGVAGGLILALVIRFGIKPETAFSIVGGALGVGLTAALAVWIEGHKRRTEELAEIELLAGALADLLNAIVRLRTPSDDQLPTAAKARALEKALEDFEDGRAILSFSIERSTIAIRSLRLFRPLFEAQKQVEANIREVRMLLDVVRTRPDETDIINVELAVAGFGALLENAVRKARDAFCA